MDVSDGWLQYTAINITASGAPDASTGFDAFTNVMSVPDVPRRPAQVESGRGARPCSRRAFSAGVCTVRIWPTYVCQVLYFFPGLQNIDWVSDFFSMSH
jgi:hypothetical protein